METTRALIPLTPLSIPSARPRGSIPPWRWWGIAGVSVVIVALLIALALFTSGTSGLSLMGLTFAGASGTSISSGQVAPSSTRTPTRPTAFNASHALVRLSQLDPAQYASAAEAATWAESACSAAAMTEVLNAYEPSGSTPYRIADVLQVEAELGEITPQLGLVEPSGIDQTVARFGFATHWPASPTLDSLIALGNRGTPVIVGFPPSRWPGGHLLVLLGGTATTVLLADSSQLDMQQMSRARFLSLWAGFAVVVTPHAPTMPEGMPASPYVQVAWHDALSAGIRPDLFVRQIKQESGFNPHALSAAGAEGIAQFMPATAAGLGVAPWDPDAALAGAARLMAEELHTYGGNEDMALSAYNAGGAAVNAARATYGLLWLAHMPQETQQYVRAIFA